MKNLSKTPKTNKTRATYFGFFGFLPSLHVAHYKIFNKLTWGYKAAKKTEK